MRSAVMARAFFALTLIGIGILGLVKGDFTAVWDPVPKDLPARDLLVYLCAFISLACGIGLLWQRRAVLAARVLLWYSLLWMLFFRVPSLLFSFAVDSWWSACKTAVMTAGAWVVYVWFATDWDTQRLGFVTGDNGLRIARALYGLALIPFGIAHGGEVLAAPLMIKPPQFVRAAQHLQVAIVVDGAIDSDDAARQRRGETTCRVPIPVVLAPIPGTALEHHFRAVQVSGFAEEILRDANDSFIQPRIQNVAFIAAKQLPNDGIPITLVAHQAFFDSCRIHLHRSCKVPQVVARVSHVRAGGTDSDGPSSAYTGGS